MRLFILSLSLILPLALLSACETDGLMDQTRSVINSTGLGSILGTESVGNVSLADLTNSEMVAGLREALKVGSNNVVNQLGVVDGFNLDPQIHIPLPSSLQKVDSALEKVGLSRLTDDLELRLNRAAETATPRAKELFFTAIAQMTINDAKNILTGPNNAATQYLRQSMGTELAKDMGPIVTAALSQAGAIQAYDSVMGQYQALPFMPDVKADLNDFVVEKALDGIFYYVAREEAAIRENPAARTTDLLKKVFGAI